jgi:hypothetical protein
MPGGGVVVVLREMNVFEIDIFGVGFTHVCLVGTRAHLHANALEHRKVVVLAAAHPVHHGGREAEGPAGHGLGVSPQDEAEVDVEEAAVGAEHDVVQVPVADACWLVWIWERG